MSNRDQHERTGVRVTRQDLATLKRLYPQFDTNAARLTAAMADLEAYHLERNAHLRSLRGEGLFGEGRGL